MNTRRIGALTIVASVLTLAACSGPPANTATAGGAPVAGAPAAGAPAAQAFTFQIQGGQTIAASAERGTAANEKRVVQFAPALERTDANIYQAALETLMTLYGKERGLIRLQDARMRPQPGLEGNPICWKISSPDADYCVVPVRDQTSGRITGLHVLVK